MSKNRKVSPVHTSLRLAPDVSANLETACKLTGWSTARTVAHLVKIGFAAAAKNFTALNGLVGGYHGAMQLHAVEVENEKRLSAARAKLRAAISRPHARRDQTAVVRVGERAAARAAKRKAASTLPPLPPAKPTSAA